MVSDRPAEAPQPPLRRVVLLGASNLTRCLPTVVELAKATWNEPLDILAAPGHGRSYGVRSSVSIRALPGIVECGLWQSLEERPATNRTDGPAETAALVTDIGNDLLYGRDVPQIIDWVEACLDRLAAHRARTILTLLPLVNLDKLPEWKFKMFRTAMFPNSRVTLAQIVDRAQDLDARLRELGAARGAALMAPRGDWYGFDPIHLRRRAWHDAWREMLSTWSDAPLAREPKKISAAREINFLRLAPARRWLCGVEQQRAQPALREADGTTLSLF